MKYQKGGEVMPKDKKPSQSAIDRMMMEGESEYQSRMNSTDRKARQEKMKKMDEEKAAKPKGMMCGGKVKKMKSGGMVRGAGKASKGVRPCKMR